MNLPEDHMDELYRKAGELYPLKTDGADWDKVMTRLQEISEEEGAPAAGRGSSRKWWWLMLLIIPFAWMGIRYIAHQGAAHPGAPGQAATGRTAAGATAPDQAAANQSAANPTAPAQTDKATSPGGATTAQANAASAAQATTAQANAAQANTAQPGATQPHGSGTAATLTPHAATAGTTSAETASGASTGRTSPGGASSGSTAGATGRTPGLTLRETLASGGNHSGNTTLENPTGPGAVEVTPADLAYTFGGADFGLPGTPKSDPRVNRTADTVFRITDTVRRPLRRAYPAAAGFYAGVEAGPDLSTIKWQELQNPGYSVGVLLGYRFNRRLAVEVSGLWAHKVYYTSGEYFNKAKTGIPQNITVGNMNGTCSMFEIPINLRWDFLYTKSGSFYATAGLSSYIMKRENYSYVASYQGASPWMADKSYQNSGNNYLSMMGLSLGYQLHWKGVGDVRIEPYFKVPLKGVGIGSLPITSSGLYLGITRSFR